MDFLDWAKEYEESAEYLRKKIKVFRTKRKNLSGKDAFVFEKNLSTMYTMYYECMATIRTLHRKAERQL